MSEALFSLMVARKFGRKSEIGFFQYINIQLHKEAVNSFLLFVSSRPHFQIEFQYSKEARELNEFTVTLATHDTVY